MTVCFTTIAAIGLHVASWHADPEFNNFNPGGYVRPDCEVLYGQPQVGVFYNSERRMSVYGGIEYEYDREAVFTPFILIGATTGYEAAPVVPLINGGVRFLFDDVGVAIGYTPEFNGYGSHLVHVAVEWRF